MHGNHKEKVTTSEIATTAAQKIIINIATKWPISRKFKDLKSHLQSQIQARITHMIQNRCILKKYI